MKEAFQLHGLPNNIIGDRVSQFISKLLKQLVEMLKIPCELSSSYHPLSDGQTKCMNQTLEQYLLCFINYQQDDWVDFLHFTKFAYNNSVRYSTGYTPIFANLGYHPRWTMMANQEISKTPIPGSFVSTPRSSCCTFSTFADCSSYTQKDRWASPSWLFTKGTEVSNWGSCIVTVT